ncbi:hypothetical protein RIF29_40356 [Crotalaria pallida]|uniref:Uncharacterized protein n=1 Tax=Crotalaria pallida TaxID=3830 RepID=A0AAN9E3I7_CROPI
MKVSSHYLQHKTTHSLSLFVAAASSASYSFSANKLYLEFIGLMASKLLQLQSKACQASQVVSKHGSSYYKQLLEKNKQHIQDPPTIEKCDQLSKQLLYTRLASIPSRYESFWKELDYVKNLWKNRQDLKVEDAGIAALFGLECFAWFCAGEVVGRGFTFTGYYV